MYKALQQELNYFFQNESLLTQALTHRSFHEINNERLEFLGDSIVNFVIAEALFIKSPKATEGELSRWRATLINRETLTQLAKRFKLNQYFILGPGELKTGGADRASILSCGMEAVIGAMYLDRGFEPTRKVIYEWYENLLNDLSTTITHKDPKTLLQEFLQQSQKKLPLYRVETIQGEAHKQTFIVSCTIGELKQSTKGKGSTRRGAEQEAATIMLEKLKND
jgi:ribonuclease-3